MLIFYLFTLKCEFFLQIDGLFLLHVNLLFGIKVVEDTFSYNDSQFIQSLIYINIKFKFNMNTKIKLRFKMAKLLISIILY